MPSRQTTVLFSLLLLAVLFPGAAWAQNALIVEDGTAGIEATALASLTTKLTGAGYAVTSNVGVPGGSLAGYSQIWDIRFNNTTPLSAGDITAYITYLSGGGALVVIGENTGFVTRNNSIVSLVATAGGGAITITTPANAETVLSPFTGPNPVSAVTFLAAAGTSSPGRGSFITRDASNIGAAMVWNPNALTNAPAGTLVAVFDVNWLDPGATADLQALSDNIITYLANPVPTVPAPPAVILMVLAGGGAVLYQLRRRRRARA
jgi:hypothetical protein